MKGLIGNRNAEKIGHVLIMHILASCCLPLWSPNLISSGQTTVTENAARTSPLKFTNFLFLYIDVMLFTVEWRTIDRITTR
jgi:hypothetical protein